MSLVASLLLGNAFAHLISARYILVELTDDDQEYPLDDFQQYDPRHAFVQRNLVEKKEAGPESFHRVDDMLLTTNQYRRLTNLTGATPSEKELAFRNGANQLEKRWPKGEVPYKISKNISSAFQKIIKQELSTINFMLKGCVQFRPLESSDEPHLLIETDPSGCRSNIGMNSDSSVTFAYLGEGCGHSIIHEMIHTLGFMHEFTRPDRDDYLKLMWNNVQAQYKHNFLQNPDYRMTYKVPYNYYSVMHYRLHSFGKKTDVKTMQAKNPVDERGIRISRLPTRSDLVKIRRMYKCEEPEVKSCPYLMFNGVCAGAVISANATFDAGQKWCRNDSAAQLGDDDDVAEGRLYEPWDFTSYKPIVEAVKASEKDLGPLWLGGRKLEGQAKPTYLSNPDVKFGFLDCDPCIQMDTAASLCAALVVDKDNGEVHIKGFDCNKEFHFLCEIPPE